jgi:bacillithiol biosynthesis deacetylase BshB1
MKLDALFFGAHPDDVELSCGGTVVKYIHAGRTAGIIDLTRGELGTRGSKEIRAKEAEKAARILGINIRENLHLQDSSIGNLPENRLKVITVIRKYKPMIIFAPYPNDRHPDHIHASELVSEGAFFSGLAKITSVYNGKAQEPYRPKRICYFMQTYTFEPSFITDITDEFDLKMKAIKCYASQFYDPNSREPETFISDKKFLEYLEVRAKFYGFHIGTQYGEPFYTKEKIKLDPFQLYI